MRLWLFAHERSQIYQHRIVTLGATDPKVFVDRSIVLLIDRLRSFAGQLGTRFADNFFSGRSGTFGTEHQPGNIFGPPTRTRFRYLGCRCCFAHRFGVMLTIVAFVADARAGSLRLNENSQKCK